MDFHFRSPEPWGGNSSLCALKCWLANSACLHLWTDEFTHCWEPAGWKVPYDRSSKRITEPCPVLEGSLLFHGTERARSRMTEKKQHWWPSAPFQNKNGIVFILQNCLNSVWPRCCARRYLLAYGVGREGNVLAPFNHLVRGRFAVFQSYVTALAWYEMGSYWVLLPQGESGSACFYLHILLFR